MTAVMTQQSPAGLTCEADLRDALTAPPRLTSEFTARLREQLRGRIDHAPGPRPTVVLDLSQVVLCDAAGLGVLVGARARARAQGVSLIMAAPSAALVRAARVTRLYRLLLVGSSSG